MFDVKKVSEDEFQDRSQAILRSHKIFIDSGVTKNISIAFELYQKVLADYERQIFVSTQTHGMRPRTEFDKYERPVCDCGTEMMFRAVLPNDEGIKCQLVCQNPKCDTVLNSDNDLDWWMSNLRKKI
jgi:hypothetical protein